LRIFLRLRRPLSSTTMNVLGVTSALTKVSVRRLQEGGAHVLVGDPRRTDTCVKADVTPSTFIVVEDNGRRSLKKILKAVRDAGGTLVYVLGIGTADNS